jgi:hypothetical protein
MAMRENYLRHATCDLQPETGRGETGYSHLDDRLSGIAGLRQALGAPGDRRALDRRWIVHIPASLLLELRAPAARGYCPYAPMLVVKLQIPRYRSG